LIQCRKDGQEEEEEDYLVRMSPHDETMFKAFMIS
jgi:hypothetical protein